jgi:hypothetical protein
MTTTVILLSRGAREVNVDGGISLSRERTVSGVRKRYRAMSPVWLETAPLRFASLLERKAELSETCLKNVGIFSLTMLTRVLGSLGGYQRFFYNSPPNIVTIQ